MIIRRSFKNQFKMSDKFFYKVMIVSDGNIIKSFYIKFEGVVSYNKFRFLQNEIYERYEQLKNQKLSIVWIGKHLVISLINYSCN